MADLPATLWATASGAGAKDGTSLANAAVSDPADANDIWSILNGGSLAQAVTEIRLCGDYTPTATADINNAGDDTHRLRVRGRNAGDTADLLIDVNAGGGAFAVFTLTAAAWAEFWNIKARNTSQGFNNDAWRIPGSASQLTWYRCHGAAAKAGWKGSATAQDLHWIECYAYDNAAEGWNGDPGVPTTQCVRCVARSNGTQGFDDIAVLDQCIADGNTQEGVRTALRISGSILYGNGASGYAMFGSGVLLTMNETSIVGNGGYGLDASNGFSSLHNVAFYNNTSGSINGSAYSSHGQITLTGDPFVDAANGDFTPSNSAAGKQIRRIAIPSADGHWTSYVDLGAVQRRPRRIIPVRIFL